MELRDQAAAAAAIIVAVIVRGILSRTVALDEKVDSEEGFPDSGEPGWKHSFRFSVKRLRRGYERGRACMPPLMVSVWDAETRLSLATRHAPGGNEVAATLAALKSLVLKGASSPPMPCIATRAWPRKCARRAPITPSSSKPTMRRCFSAPRPPLRPPTPTAS